MSSTCGTMFVMNNLGIRLRLFLYILIGIVAVGTAGFMMTEGLSIEDAFYFSIVTVTTVGYGDISPVTTAGKVLSIFLIITGVGTFLGVVANATEILLNKQEQKARMEKLNMVMGVFFSEAGTRLLTYFTESDPAIHPISSHLMISSDWTRETFLSAGRRISDHTFSSDIHKIDIDSLRAFLNEKSDVILRLLENPSLLEHESFTDLIRALLHLKDELSLRENLDQLPESDYQHLAGDIRRAYTLLSAQWLNYAHYLKDYYPYLFSLAVRTNPFNATRSVIVKQ
jgi:voltage-gated potassium channel